MKNGLCLIVGPTASGKGAVGVALARMWRSEIVSVDSMKVYRGMDIGTAKPPPAVRSVVRHYMIDVAHPWETFTLARYLKGAVESIAAISRSDMRPLLVGGTPLYVRGLLYGVFDGPEADWPLRKRLYQLAERRGPAALHETLRKVDPVAAEALHPNDVRRVVRAIEVHGKTGKPISRLQAQYPAPAPARKAEVFVLVRTRKDLRRRIETRLSAMWRDGLVDEVASLLASERGLARGPRQAVGYKEVIAHLEGQCSAKDAREAIRRNTWRVARKQMTWLRGFSDARWLDVKADESPERTARRVADLAHAA